MSRFDLIRLYPVLLEISEINVECHVWRSPRNHRRGGLISFSGRYQPDSAGADDARYIRWTLRQFLDLVHVDGLVINCTKLDYESGDDLNFIISSNIPYRVVVQADQRTAFAGVVDPKRLGTDLDAELTAMADAIRNMKSRL